MHKTEKCLRTADFYCVHGTHRSEFSMRTERKIVRTFAVRIVIYFAGQNIDYYEKRKWPKGFICPCTGVKYHNIQTCLLVYAADSGERLQDHWSSGFSKHLLLVHLRTRRFYRVPTINVLDHK